MTWHRARRGTHVSDAVVSAVRFVKGAFNNGAALAYPYMFTVGVFSVDTLCVGRGRGGVPDVLVRGPNSIRGGATP